MMTNVKLFLVVVFYFFRGSKPSMLSTAVDEYKHVIIKDLNIASNINKDFNISD